MLAIRGGRPELLNLRDIIEAFVQFREEVITRRSKFELAKARDRAHILLGLVIAVTNLDEVVRIIRGSASPAEARDALLAREWPIAEIAPLHPRWSKRSTTEVDRRHLSPVRHPGPRDPRPAPPPPDRARPRRDRRRAREAGRRSIAELLEILGNRARLYEVMRRGTDRGPRRLRDPAPHRDRRRRRRDRGRGPDRARGHGRHRDGRGLYQAHPARHLPRADAAAARAAPAWRPRTRTSSPNLFVTSTHTPVLFFSTHGKVYRMKVWRLPEGGAEHARAADDQPAAAGRRARRSRPSCRCPRTRTSGASSTSCSRPPRATCAATRWTRSPTSAPRARSR